MEDGRLAPTELPHCNLSGGLVSQLLQPSASSAAPKGPHRNKDAVSSLPELRTCVATEICEFMSHSRVYFELGMLLHKGEQGDLLLPIFG